MDGERRAVRLVRRFTVARLLERDDFTRRMAEAQAISALELLYPVLQGYDSVAVEVLTPSSAAPTRRSTCCSGRRAGGLRPGAPVDSDHVPIPPGTDGVQEDEQELRQLRRGDGSARGDVRCR